MQSLISVRTLVLLITATVAGFGLTQHARVLSIAAPQEYREPGILLQTRLLLAGQNPYALENQPVYTNIYGILYPCVAYPLARLAGSTYFVHRLLSGACVVATCGLLYGCLRRQGVEWWLAVTAGVMLYADLALRAGILRGGVDLIPLSLLARPDALGMLLMMLAILVPWRWNYSTRSLIASIILSVLAFLTKPYFVLALPIVALHLFLHVGRVKALVYAAVGIALLMGTTGVVTLLCPCYLADVIRANVAFGASAAWNPHIQVQFWHYLKFVPGTVLLALAAVICWVRSGGWRIRVRWRDWRRPLLNRGGDLFAVWLIVSLLALYLRLGRHTGNTMLYLFQLLSPPLLIVSFRFLNQHARGKQAWLVAALAVDLLLILFMRPELPRHHSEAWAQWEQILAPRQNVYAPPPLSEILARQGKPVYESGLSDSFPFALEAFITPRPEQLKQRYAQYLATIERSVEESRLDMIIIPYYRGIRFTTFIPVERLPARYRRLGPMRIPMDFQQDISADIWVRKSDAESIAPGWLPPLEDRSARPSVR